MVRYSLLRILIFLGCLCLFWLLGLRGQDQEVLLLFLAAGVSMAISFFVLRGPREEFSEKIAAKVDERNERKAQARHLEPTDEDIEDAALDEADQRSRPPG